MNSNWCFLAAHKFYKLPEENTKFLFELQKNVIKKRMGLRTLMLMQLQDRKLLMLP